MINNSTSNIFSLDERKERVRKAIALLRNATQGMRPPLIALINQLYGKDPFLILISCLLSLRARDIVTFDVCKKLFARAKTPHELLSISISELEEIISPINFYKRKAYILHDVSKDLIRRFDGKVPSNEKDLLSIKGVGRKTANLVLGTAFDIPAICVDTHVHRLSNRLGWVRTTTVEETEQELQRIVPVKDWVDVNYLLVMWGQNICVPISPFCSTCVLSPLCPKIGVIKQR